MIDGELIPEAPVAPSGLENLGELIFINRLEGPYWISVLMALAVFCFFTALYWPTIRDFLL